MARKCFEVVTLKFRFNSYGKTLTGQESWVSEELRKYLKRYSSNTSLKYCCATLEDGDIVVEADFSKKISLNTVNKILLKMYAENNNKLHIDYGEIKKTVTVSVLS